MCSANTCSNAIPLPLQFCTCPVGYKLLCPDNGTAPGCVLLPISSKGWGAVGVVIALLVVSVAAVLCKRQLIADLCRLCLGADNPLGKVHFTHLLFLLCCSQQHCRQSRMKTVQHIDRRLEIALRTPLQQQMNLCCVLMLCVSVLWFGKHSSIALAIHNYHAVVLTVHNEECDQYTTSIQITLSVPYATPAQVCSAFWTVYAWPSTMPCIRLTLQGGFHGVCKGERRGEGGGACSGYSQAKFAAVGVITCHAVKSELSLVFAAFIHSFTWTEEEQNIYSCCID